jgi:hypothetical protein
MSFQNGDLSRKSECLICVYHKKQITDNDKITFPHDISNQYLQQAHQRRRNRQKGQKNQVRQAMRAAA